MNIIHSNKRLPYLQKTEAGYALNINQRYITNPEEETATWEIYQETFRRFPTIREKLEAVKSAVTMHANSDAVKHFTLGTTQSWLDSEQRASIKDAIEASAKAGHKTYTLWLNSQPHEMLCDRALDLISTIEYYSSQCYNMTAQYHLDIEQCGADIESACEIDFTQGYPSPPDFEA